MPLAYFDVSMSQIVGAASLGLPPLVGLWPETVLAGGIIVNHWIRMIGVGILVAALLPTVHISQTKQSAQSPGRYALIGIMRAIDERHNVDLEAGYIRHLEWHRRVKDPFSWYSYSFSASTDRQRQIIYSTFGHTAAELSNPVSPVEDCGTRTLTCCSTSNSREARFTSS
jgi:hypothetical protein